MAIEVIAATLTADVAAEAKAITEEVKAMAVIAAPHSFKLPQPRFRPIVDPATLKRTDASAAPFDPAKHLAFTPPSETIMMSDLGFPEDLGVSPVAVSQPFQLFSQDAIKLMRSEIFKKEVAENCMYSSNLAACQLRGYAPKYAPFIYDAWNHPETLSIISKVAGVDLVPVMDFELGHINISHKSEKQVQDELKAVADDDNAKPIVGWHNDSYPFVCVTMLSDCTNMVGGETALRNASGEVLRVRGPTMGYAVVLQGRYITHQALRALGATERITSVTSFRPRSPFLKDDSVLTTVRGISDLSELYFGFAEYRLEMLAERFNDCLKQLRTHHRAGRRFATSDFKAFLKEQEAFIKHTDNEVVQDEEVMPGFCPALEIPDVVVEDGGAKSPKRARVE